MFAIKMTKESNRSINPTNSWGDGGTDLVGPMTDKDYTTVVQEVVKQWLTYGYRTQQN